MITSLYYYNYYKPNILKNTGVSLVKQNSFKQVAHQNSSTKPINLSAAYKNNVLEYVKDLSNAVNTTKTSSTEIIALANDLTEDKDTVKKGMSKDLKKKRTDEENKKEAKNILAKLSDGLNKTVEFSKSSSQSEEFNSFSNNLKNFVSGSIPFKNLGLTFSDDKFFVDEDKINELDNAGLKKYLNGSTNDASEISKKAKEFLTKPLASHMSFKSFSYYYSYSSGIIKNDSFNLISTGTLLNLEL